MPGSLASASTLPTTRRGSTAPPPASLRRPEWRPSPRPLEILAETFARWLGRWRGEGLPVRRHWLAAAHPLGTALSTPENESLFDGLDETGARRLRLADGTQRMSHAGDVFLP